MGLREDLQETLEHIASDAHEEGIIFTGGGLEHDIGLQVLDDLVVSKKGVLWQL
jgi:hypothetical protein